MEDDKVVVLLRELIRIADEISAISDFKCIIRRECRDLSRRLKLLTPLFVELIDIREQIPVESVEALILLKEASESAKELLKIASRGSKIYLLLQLKQIKSKIHEVTCQLEHALSGVSYDKLDIPDELKEQVTLVHSQFQKSKGRNNSHDLVMCEDLLSVSDHKNGVETHPAFVSMLCKKLELFTVEDIKEESIALHEMVTSSDWNVEENFEKMFALLKKFEVFMQAEDTTMSTYVCKNCSSIDKACNMCISSSKSPVVPDDFRCPISLELMTDPVIICTGQTYEHSCIKKWLEAGHGTCPKTQQKLFSSTLTPNYALCSLISNWCETNGVELPKRTGDSRLGKTEQGIEIDALLAKLTCVNIEDQRDAAGELRLLAKNNGDNRMLIAEAGAIPLLVGLLFTTDSPTQEHAVTALLNLSICEYNKLTIISYGAVPGVIFVLENGSMEARANAAATIFSLSTEDEFKAIIGALGAIPVLVKLLKEGSQRAKKDAAAALFNLCKYQVNKGRGIRAGMVPLLMTLLTEPSGEMVDEALAIISMLAGHPEGKVAIADLEVVPVLAELIRNGTRKNRENAAAVLMHLCAGDQRRLLQAQALDVIDPLLDLAENGTERARRKAVLLLELLGNAVDQRELAELLDATQSDTQTPSPSSC